MGALIRPLDEIDLALIVSLLREAEIPFYVHNHHFGSLYPGFVAPLFNERTVIVPGDRGADAEAIVGSLRRAGGTAPRSDRLRCVLELLILGWFVRGRATIERLVPSISAALVLAPLFWLAVWLALLPLVLVTGWWSGMQASP